MSRLLESVFKNISVENKTILEAGCGAGTMTKFLLSNKAAEVIAVSNRKEDLEYCKEQLDDDRINRVRLTEGDLTDIPQIPSSSVDIVTAYFLFNVVNPFDLERILNEIERILKKGGVLVVIDYTPFDFYRDETSYIQREIWNIENALKVLQTGEKAYHEYTPQWVCKRCKLMGMEIIVSEIPIEKVNWTKKLLYEHGEGIKEQIKRIKEEKLRDGLAEKLEKLLQKVANNDIHSGQIFSMTARKPE